MSDFVFSEQQDSFGFSDAHDDFDWKETAKGDPGEGVPTGGTTGQYLRKKSDEDYDTEWATLSNVATLEYVEVTL